MPPSAAVPLTSQKDLWDLPYNKLKEEEPKLFKAYQRCILNPDSSNRADATPSILTHDSMEKERYLAEKIGARLQEIKGKQSPIAQMRHILIMKRRCGVSIPVLVRKRRSRAGLAEYSITPLFVLSTSIWILRVSDVFSQHPS